MTHRSLERGTVRPNSGRIYICAVVDNKLDYTCLLVPGRGARSTASGLQKGGLYSTNWFYNEMLSFRVTEVEVYRRTQKIQGKNMPRFCLPVVLSDNATSGDMTIEAPEGLRCPGILLKV